MASHNRLGDNMEAVRRDELRDSREILELVKFGQRAGAGGGAAVGAREEATPMCRGSRAWAPGRWPRRRGIV